jgi:hypothetical protein
MKVTVLEVGSAGPRSARFVFDSDPSSMFWVSEMIDETKEIQLPNVGFGEPFDP